MRGPSPLYIEERHRALGRDATFSWSRALTHPPRCNRRVTGAAILISWWPPSWCRGGRPLGVVGAAILDRKSRGPPSWIGSDVIGAIVGPILLTHSYLLASDLYSYKAPRHTHKHRTI